MWVSLGTMNLSYDWQSFSVPVVGSETFRLLMDPNAVTDGPLLICQYFALSGQGRAFRVYHNREPLVLSLPVPVDLQSGGEVVRFIQARKSNRARVLGSANWTLEVEAFI